MRPDEPDVNVPSAIVDRRDETILIAADVEHDSASTKDIGAAKHEFHIRRLGPLKSSNNMNPGLQRLLGVAATGPFPERLQRADGNYSHSSAYVNAFSYWEQAIVLTLGSGRRLVAAAPRIAVCSCSWTRRGRRA